MDLPSTEILKDSELIQQITFWGMNLLTAIAILLAGWIIGKWLSNRVKKVKKLDATLKAFLGGLLKYAILAIAFVAVLGQLGVQTASLLAVLGAAGLAIGLALQGTLSNVAAGVMLLILRPFNVGDYIETGNIKGTVKSLSLFATELSTVDNVHIFTPNNQLWNTAIFNFSRNRQRRIDLVNGISYSDDIEKALKVIEKEVSKEKRLVDTEGKTPLYFVSTLADSSVNITARFWVESSDYWNIKWGLTKSVKEALDKGGLTIPFPTRTIEMVGNK
ncbi:MAG: mechanosensitive ion channel [Alphaproteobacteria bacterium]|nr:mechanosensitive ion channel [Alphaproteobacteria bacterium]